MMHSATTYHNSFNGPYGYAGKKAKVDQLFYSWTEYLALAERGRYYGIEEALRLARTGWPEGLKHAKSISSAIIDRYSASITRPEMHFQDYPGMDFDLSLVLAGETEHWNAIDQIETPDVIRIVLNCSVTMGLTDDAIMWRGATTAALVQLLEESGRRTEVVVMDATDNGGTGGAFGMAITPVIECYVMVKPAGTDLDLDRVTFALANPAMERVLMFSAESRTARGTAVECANRGDIYIPCAVYGEGCNWNDEKACHAWIAKHLKEQGVIASE